jgi:hypothetical protein
MKAVVRTLSAEEDVYWGELPPECVRRLHRNFPCQPWVNSASAVFSQCADPLLPACLMYGHVNKVAPPCWSAYVLGHRICTCDSTCASTEYGGKW